MKLKAILAAAILGIIFLFNSAFIVMQTEQAIILQFGEYIRTIREPGLSFKVPFVQTVTKIDRRLLSYDLPQRKITLGDQKFLVVDAYTRYRIAEPLKFFKSVRNERNAQNRLVPIVMGKLQSALGQTTLSELLSEKRVQILKNIVKGVDTALLEFGIDLVDVRIRKADLPPENSQAIFERMQSDRAKEANRLRAEGEEKALIIRASADRQVATLLSDAKKEAIIIKAKAEASATKILTQAFSADRKLFEFLQKMSLLEKTIDSDTPLYLSTETHGLDELVSKH